MALATCVLAWTAIGAGALTQERTADSYGELPLCFEENRGQSDPAVRFLARGGGGATFVARDALVFASGESSVRLEPIGGSLARASGSAPLETRVNYYAGADSERWIEGVPCFERVTIDELWPGIDLELYGNLRRAEYDLVLAPHADPALIRFVLESSSALRIDARGDLVAQDGSIAQLAPIAYQVIDGARCEVESRFVLEDAVLGFELGAYDRSRELVIDPMWLYANLIGRSGRDMAWDIAVDSQGTAFLAGETNSTGYPMAVTTGALGGYDVMVAKVNPQGTQLVWLSLIGGGGDEKAYGIAIQPSVGIAFIAGYTNSPNMTFPTTAGAYDRTHNGGVDAFVAKLDANGGLSTSTLIGAAGDDVANAIAIEASTGIPFITGYTTSGAMTFPTTMGVLDRSHNGGADVFVTKLSANFASVSASTLIGNGGNDSGSDIALVGGTVPIVCGTTDSANFPGPAGNLASLGGNDAFVVKLNAAFSMITNGKRVGDSGDDRASALTCDAQGICFVGGYTMSSSMTALGTVNPLQNVNAGGWDVLLFGLNANMTNLTWLSFLGGTGWETCTDLMLDSAGQLHITGNTDSTNFPTQNPLQAANAGMYDGWLARVSTGVLNTLGFATYFGTAGHDTGFGLGIDGAGMIYIGGYAGGNVNWGTSAMEFDTSFGGGSFDALAIRFSP